MSLYIWFPNTIQSLQNQKSQETGEHSHSGSSTFKFFALVKKTQTPLAISLVVIMVSNKASYVRRKSIVLVVTVTPWAFLCTYLYHLCRLHPNSCLLKNQTLQRNRFRVMLFKRDDATKVLMRQQITIIFDRADWSISRLTEFSCPSLRGVGKQSYHNYQHQVSTAGTNFT